MAETAVVEPEAKASNEFSAGWNDSEFGDPEPTNAADAAAKADADAKPDADAAGTDDADADAAAKAAADAAAAASAKEATAAAEEKPGDYKPDYEAFVKDVRRENDQNYSRIEKLIEQRPAPAVYKPTRVDLAEFKGYKLKSRLEKVRDAAPEAADAFEPIIEGLAGALGDAYKEVDIVRATATDTRAATAQQAQFAPVEAKHPGFQETIKGDEFLKWLDEQTGKVMRTAHNTNDPNEFVGILDQFAAREGAAAGDGTDAATGGDDDAARVEARREAARQPATRTTADRQPDKQRDLSDEEAFSKGWFDPEFDTKT